MAYEIIAMGDAEMLRQAFEGVALMTGGDDFKVMIKIGLIIGLIFGAFKAAINTKLDLMPMVVGFFAYMIMFAPKVTVNIIDPFGDLPMIYCSVPGTCASGAGGALTVANVPIGIALPMSVVSSFSINVSEKFSQVFSAPNMYQNGDGYLNGVQILARLRKFTGATANGNGDTTGNTNIRQSFVRYWRDCVQYSLDSNKKTFESIVKSSDLAGALVVDNAARDTMMYTGGTPTQMSCADASNTLLPLMKPGTAFSGELKTALQTGDTNTTFDALTAALKDTTKNSSIDAERAMLNAYMRNMMSCAQSDLPDDACITMTQATEQRNAQWAMEQSVFKQIARPLMAFVEMFMVAATPIMAFLVASGMGLPLAMKYFGMVAWIALWPCTMTLCNIYIYNAAGRAFNAKIPDGPDPSSMLSIQGLESMFTTASDWVATGSMLASAVPALTMMLVYGSSSALSGIAGRLQSSGHIDEKLTAPDLHKTAAFNQDQSHFTGNKSVGGSATGTLSSLPKVSGSAMAQAGASQSQTYLENASQQLQDTLGSELSTSISKQKNSSAMQSYSKSLDRSRTAQDIATRSNAVSTLKTAGVTDSEISGATASADAQAGLGIKVLGSGISAGVDMKTSDGKSIAKTSAITQAFNDIATTSNSVATATRTSMLSSEGKSLVNSLISGSSASNKQAMTQALGNLTSAQESVQASQSVTSTIGMIGDKDIQSEAAAIQSAENNGRLPKGALANAVNSAGPSVIAASKTHAQRLLDNHGLDKDKAEVGGQVMALIEAGLGGNQKALSDMSAIHGAASGVTPTATTPLKNLGDTNFAATKAAADATGAKVASGVAGVPAALNQATSLLPSGSPSSTASKPAAGGHSMPAKHAGMRGGSGPHSSPSAASHPAAPGTTSNDGGGAMPTFSAEQNAMVENAKANLQPSAATVDAVAGKIPSMTKQVVSSGTGVVGQVAKDAGKAAIDYAKEHPVEAAGMVAAAVLTAGAAVVAAPILAEGAAVVGAIRTATGIRGLAKVAPGLSKMGGEARAVIAANKTGRAASQVAATSGQAIASGAANLSPLVSPAASSAITAARTAKQAEAVNQVTSLLGKR